ncbi:MAG: Ger(x)C family spore germination protein [Clostridiales bacterium]|nr:Ger(x)C family spore germination protein [Clostridiales bacterium]
MKLKKRAFIIIILTTMLCIFLSGCWNNRRIDSLAFAISMGFDKTDKGILLTVEVLNPHAIASQKTINEPTVVLYTEEGQSTNELVRKIITQSSRKVNVTHLQTVVFGEEFAKEGISDVLDYLTREHQVRTDLYFVVARENTAYRILNNLTKLDTNPSVKLSASLKASDETWAGTRTVKVIDLVNSIISDGAEPAITGVIMTGHSKVDDNLDDLKEVKADPLKIIDLAVFKKDKLVGWLNESECKGYNYVTNHVPSSMTYVEDRDYGIIGLEVIGTKTKVEASLENGKPIITVNMKIRVNIESATDKIDLSKGDNIHYVENLAEAKLTKNVGLSIMKAKRLQSDIFGFGDVVHRTYPKEWEKFKDDWDKEFAKMPVVIKGTVRVVKTGTISNSYFMKEKK